MGRTDERRQAAQRYLTRKAALQQREVRGRGLIEAPEAVPIDVGRTPFRPAVRRAALDQHGEFSPVWFASFEETGQLHNREL